MIYDHLKRYYGIEISEGQVVRLKVDGFVGLLGKVTASHPRVILSDERKFCVHVTEIELAPDEKTQALWKTQYEIERMTNKKASLTKHIASLEKGIEKRKKMLENMKGETDVERTT